MPGCQCPGVIGAGSVKSPQHCMTAIVAKHLGMQSFHVLGATTPASCLKHDSVAIAAAAGAEFAGGRCCARWGAAF